MLIGGLASPPPISVPAPEREKRDSQVIIDTLRDTLEERHATMESLQKALDKSEMLCSTLKVGLQLQGAQVGGKIEPQGGVHHSRLSFWFYFGQQLGLRNYKMKANPFFLRPSILYPPSPEEKGHVGHTHGLCTR